jgi:hypothetical protein
VLLQQAVAATIAWVLATHVVDHHRPFFAPIAAIAALNAPLGERGGNALRLLQGVVIGILTGGLSSSLLGATPWALLLGALTGMATARALGGTAMAIAQAAAAAILTVTIGDTDAGPARLIDALIGGGVALVFSQVLFAPEPVSMLRRAESATLADIAAAFDLAARAIDEDDEDLAGRAVDSLRDRSATLGRIRYVSHRVARHSAAWRSQRDRVVREEENAGQLDLLGGSALMVVRNATAAGRDERGVLAPVIRDLAARVREMAQDPGDRAVRQRAAVGVLKAVRPLRADDRFHVAAPDPALAATVVAMHSAVVDAMLFAGVDADQAARAIRRDDSDIDVPTPPPTARMPFNRAWRPWKRWV